MALIPNIHLETPNYTVTRLRHDELNQMEPLPASYRMVDQPAEAEKAAAPGQEAKPARPQAAVQGITPEQPAPVPVEAPPPSKPSILQKIFGWLTRQAGDQAGARADASTRVRGVRRATADAASAAAAAGRKRRRPRFWQGGRAAASGAAASQERRRERGAR